jgi:hypothetical protein
MALFGKPPGHSALKIFSHFIIVALRDSGSHKSMQKSIKGLNVAKITRYCIFTVSLL